MNPEETYQDIDDKEENIMNTEGSISFQRFQIVLTKMGLNIYHGNKKLVNKGKVDHDSGFVYNIMVDEKNQHQNFCSDMSNFTWIIVPKEGSDKYTIENPYGEIRPRLVPNRLFYMIWSDLLTTNREQYGYNNPDRTDWKII